MDSNAEEEYGKEDEDEDQFEKETARILASEHEFAKLSALEK